MNAELRNPVINDRYFKPQKEWGWQVGFDLYFAGMGSGSLLVGLSMVWLGYSPYTSPAIFLWGPFVIGLGASFLVLKLGIKHRFLNAVLNPGTSWLSRGFYILTGCMIFGIALLVLVLLPNFDINTDNLTPAIRALEIIVFIFALGVAVYTGILVRSVRFVSFWHTWLLPALFTVSSLTTGTAATLFATYTYDVSAFDTAYSAPLRDILMTVLQILILVEALVFVLFLYARYRFTDGLSVESIRYLIFGKLKYLFWAGIVAAGFALPSVLPLFYFRYPDNPYLLYSICGLVLAGRLLLRLGIIYSGIKDPTPWHRMAEVGYYVKFPNAGVIPLRSE